MSDLIVQPCVDMLDLILGDNWNQISYVHEQITDSDYNTKEAEWIHTQLDDYPIQILNANLPNFGFLGVEDSDYSKTELIQKCASVTGHTYLGLRRYVLTTLGKHAYTEFGSIHGTIVLGERALHFLGYEIEDDNSWHLSTHRQIPIDRIEDVSIRSLVRFDGFALLMLSLLWDPQRLFGSGRRKGPLSAAFEYQIQDAELKRYRSTAGKYYEPLSDTILPSDEILRANIFSKAYSDYSDQWMRDAQYMPLRVIKFLGKHGAEILDLTGFPEVGPLFFDNDTRELSLKSPRAGEVVKFPRPQLFSRSLAVTVTDSRNGQKYRFESVSSKSDDFVTSLIDEVTLSGPEYDLDNAPMGERSQVSNGDLVSQIQRLASMHQDGLLSLEEFTMAKEKLLKDI